MKLRPVVHRMFSRWSWCLLLCSLATAQEVTVPARITQPIDETSLVILKGNTHPLARPEFDRGAAPLDLPLNRMLLVLQRSPQQEAALRQLLGQQQQKSSSSYHAWLTPEQFGLQFGPADEDIRATTSWLESHGFAINRVAHGRTIIEFSGTAGQVKEAFHTEIHKYERNGEEHWANSSNPKIPDALRPAVAGIASLHNFPRKPLHHVVGIFSRAKGTERYEFHSSPEGPLWTTGGPCGLAGTSCYVVVPYDFATIYNVLPLWKANPAIDGTGQTIAIVSQSDIYPQDFHNFRTDFGLPSGTLNIIYDGPPANKLPTSGDELESDLDVEWAGSVAKGATIDLVVSISTNTTAGVDLSALYIVDNNVAPVISESYGACELDMGTAGNQFYNQLWQQAAAEGITAFVSTGDSGSAVCDLGSEGATQGLSVNGISSTPYNVAVGGTDFDDYQNPSAYWNSSNDPKTFASAKGYVPEMSWNDTCTNSEFFPYTGQNNAESDCNDSSSRFWPSFVYPIGGSGGESNCTVSENQQVSSCSGGYDKPSWQTGPGVPNDGKRDLPDVSLFAADGLNASFYVVCMTDIYEGCDGEVYTLVAVGGTSASSPAFAGIMAMVNQQTQSRQGNANYSFYPLAVQPGATCDSTGIIGPSCIFYDVTQGTIAMPCVTGSLDCVTNFAGDQYGVLSGYSTTTGYDLATGLGSVNAANLVNNWNTVAFQPTSSTLSLSPTAQITHGSPVNVNLTVTPQSGTGTPTGQVSLLTSAGPVAGTYTLSNGSVSTTTELLPGGSYTVTAHYAGDGTYGASDSSPAILVTVSPEPSTTTLKAFSLDQNGNPVSFTSGPYGGTIVYVSATVAGESGQGVPTGTVDLRQTVSGTTTKLPGDPFALNSQGLTMYPFPGYTWWAYTPGTYTINGIYSGDASFLKNNASSIGFTITQAPTNTTIWIPNCNPGNGVCVFGPGTNITIFANVNYSGGAFIGGVFADAPTGTVTFYSNGTALGPPVPLDSNIAPPVASMSTTQLVGPNSITAQYNADSNFSGSTSSAILVEVGETFTITANPTTINIASPGQSGSTTLTFTAQNGLTGSTNLSPSMCSNLPPKSSCSFNPSTVTFTSSKTVVPVTLTITTTAPGSAPTSAQNDPQRSLRGFRVTAAIFAFGLCVLPICTRRCCWRVMVGLIVLVMIAAAVACGGGGGTASSGAGGGGGGGGGNSGTPPGTYSGVTVTVTIGGVTQSMNNLSVIVQ